MSLGGGQTPSPAPPGCWWEPLGDWELAGLRVTSCPHHGPKKGRLHLDNPLEKSLDFILSVTFSLDSYWFKEATKSLEYVTHQRSIFQYTYVSENQIWYLGLYTALYSSFWSHLMLSWQFPTPINIFNNRSFCILPIFQFVEFLIIYLTTTPGGYLGCFQFFCCYKQTILWSLPSLNLNRWSLLLLIHFRFLGMELPKGCKILNVEPLSLTHSLLSASRRGPLGWSDNGRWHTGEEKAAEGAELIFMQKGLEGRQEERGPRGKTSQKSLTRRRGTEEGSWQV